MEVKGADRMSLNSIAMAVNNGMMLSALLTNWCRECGKWRFHSLSLEALATLTPESKFNCIKCGAKIALIKDKEHILLQHQPTT